MRPTPGVPIPGPQFDFYAHSGGMSGGGMAFGDANKDGKMDVAIADHCRGAYVFLGDGAGNWKTWHFAIFSQMSIGESRV
jgi:hypothetical protein